MWLGLDIGGANLKAADGRGAARLRPFPLWRRRGELVQALAELIAEFSEADGLAVTMTGELADCFETKAQGVAAIVDAVVKAAGGRAVRVYRNDGSFAGPQDALADPLTVAAANWHALARFAGRYAPQKSALVMDIGSTTCDLIPLVHGLPSPRGRTDPERLVSGELVYTGVQRSPVCAVASRVPWRGFLCPLAQELFATTWDVYLLLGDLPEAPDRTDTADGRPATRQAAHDRLARAICADRTMVDWAAAEAIARAIAEAQLDQLAEAADRVISMLPERPTSVVLSGQGEFLARRVLERLGLSTRIVSLAETLGPDVSCTAAAHAVAVLAAESTFA